MEEAVRVRANGEGEEVMVSEKDSDLEATWSRTAA